MRPLLRLTPLGRLLTPSLPRAAVLARPFHPTPTAPKKAKPQPQRNPQARFAEDDLEPGISKKTYDYLAERTLDTFFDNVEIASEERPELDIDSNQGVVTLKTPQGTYVLNKQPTNLQIWLSSPVSGPKRFDYDTETRRWVYERTGEDLQELLMQEVGVAPDDITIEREW